MYSVMIVDDEPAAIHYLTAIIEKKCKNFHVIGTANDGGEALTKIKELEPDVLLFDICMPVVDGVLLSAKIKEWNRPVIMIAISGHSEFEYARETLKNGAMDYLLKPIVPTEAKSVFDTIEKRLELFYHQERMKILRNLGQDIIISENEMTKCFKSQKYYIALARINGLPSRFSAINAREVFSDVHEMLITYGRDEMENLFLCPFELIEKDNFENVIRNQILKVPNWKGYYTIILYREPISYKKISQAAKKMYQLLNNHVIVGENVTLYIENNKEQNIKVKAEEIKLISEFEYYTQVQDFVRLRNILNKLFILWGKEKRPLLWVERRVRDMNHSMELYAAHKSYDENYLENEYAIEEAFSNSLTMLELMINIEEIMFKDRNCNIAEERLDTEMFIEKICGYFNNNMNKEITVQEISKEFGVSQTYLGKLFRKYKGMSFKNYLTMTKMERAMELMRENDDILIKELAERLGYRDQFYFSRVFRSYTGMCPSDFIEYENNK